ncbi:MAG TPA: hypothetical protein VMJ73_13585 [Rhizomicrobium sp.]|nr:hypothetical protein [Rhizomicrobium sp.]HUN92205.1 hypothetical protein [Burkholderiaceae bacterium]
MASLVLGAVGTSLGGSLFGGGLSFLGATISGAQIGGALGAFLGSEIDAAIAGIALRARLRDGGAVGLCAGATRIGRRRARARGAG